MVISERLPSRVGGGCARQYNLIRELSADHSFTVVAFADDADREHLPELERFVRRVETVQIDEPELPTHSRMYWQLNGWRRTFFDPMPLRGQFQQHHQMRSTIQRVLAEQAFDIVQVHQAYMARMLPRLPGPAVLDLHDVLSDYERRAIGTSAKATHRFQTWVEWRKMQALERRVARRFAVCTTVSEHDRVSFANLTGHRRIEVVPNGVDIDYFRPGSVADKPNLLYVGSMGFPPNADAARWFSRAILPIIQAHVPDVHLDIVGIDPPADVVRLGGTPAIRVTGYVDDVRPYFDRAAVVVVPLRLGSGTRLKILDAWAMGRAVVATSVGAEGLNAVHGENALLCDDVNGFAHAVIQVLSDSALRVRLGSTGRQTVEQQYSWAAIGKKLDQVYHSCRPF